MLHHFFRQANFKFGRPDTGEINLSHGLRDGGVHCGMIVPKDDGTEGGVIIQIALSVSIVEISAFGALPDDRVL